MPQRQTDAERKIMTKNFADEMTNNQMDAEALRHHKKINQFASPRLKNNF
jgi:hypothetical protein